MKRITQKLFLLLTVTVCLCGCNSKQNNGYVDVSDYEKSIENSGYIENTNLFSDQQFDDKAMNTMSITFTVNGEHLYSTNSRNLIIEGDGSEVRTFCRKAGCAHDPDISDCMAYRRLQSPLSSPDGIYYCMDNKLCLYDGLNNKVILENNFYTEYEEEVYPDYKSGIFYLVYNDGLLYIAGATYYFTYDPSSGERSEPIVISDSCILSLDVDDGNLYFATDSAELNIYIGSSGQQKKLDDNVWKLDFVNGRLYYTKYENGVPMLYSADKNGGDVNKIIEDCYVNCCITDSCIYYQNYSDPERSVFVCNSDGSNPQKIVFPKMKIIDENGEEKEETEEYSVGLVNIVTSGSSNKVFMISRSRIYSFDKGSEKSVLISIADHLVYEDDK